MSFNQIDKQALGIDIGGSGIKGAVVDLNSGEFITKRHRIPTPQPATPKAVVKVVKEIVDHFDWEGPVGIALPTVIINGVAKTAVNIDKKWIDTDAIELFSQALGRKVTMINDADAAGIAELVYGAVREYTGTVILLTLGTGIGSALIHNKQLIPNTELGQLDFEGKPAEKSAAASVKEKEDLSFSQWAKTFNKVLKEYERILNPELFIIGGGISKKAHKWMDHITVDTPLVTAALENTAGIVGVAHLAWEENSS